VLQYDAVCLHACRKEGLGEGLIVLGMGRQLAQLTQDRQNRRAASIGSIFSSTWPGGEQLRYQGGKHAEAPAQVHPSALVVKNEPRASHISRRPASNRSRPGAVARSLHVVARKEVVTVSAIDQVPWNRACKARLLTDAELKRISVYGSQQQLLSGLQLQGGGIAIRPLSLSLDLVQVFDAINADTALWQRPVVHNEENDATLDTSPSQSAPSYFREWQHREATRKSSASVENAWLQGLLDTPQSVLELGKQLQDNDAAALYAIVDMATDRPIGVMTLRGNAPESLRIEIGRILLPHSLRTSAVLVQTLSLLLLHVFEHIRYFRVQVPLPAFLAP